MNSAIDINKPLWQLTVGEFLELRNILVPEQKPVVQEYDGDRYVFGIAGIARLLGCSKTMVCEYRKNGWIEPAIKQNGRKIVCDAKLALELFGQNNKKP
jgi:hypothetical protein